MSSLKFILKPLGTLVVAIVLFPIVSFGQFDGIYIDQGVTFPGLFFKDIDEKIVIPDSNRKVSYMLDIGLRYKVLPHFHFVSGVIFEERGWYTELVVFNAGTGLYLIRKAKMNYPFLTAPVLLEYSLGSKMNVFLNTGINASYRLGKRHTDPNQVSLSLYHPEHKAPRWDISWTANFGLRLPIKERLKINLKATLFRSYSAVGIWYPIERVTRHKGYRVSVGVLYSLKNKKE